MTNMCLKNAIPDRPNALSITQQHDFLQAYLPLEQVVTRRFSASKLSTKQS